VITELGNRTGVPVVLNTSFNIQGEPVVESPRDAIRCFFSTGLDHLCIGSFVVSKKPQSGSATSGARPERTEAEKLNDQGREDDDYLQTGT